jgi:hypothetical protein
MCVCVFQQAVLASGVLPAAVRAIDTDDIEVVEVALSLLGSVVGLAGPGMDAAIEAGCIPALISLLRSSHRGLIKHACWIFSNITAGTREQIEQVVAAGALTDIVRLVANAPWDLKTQAARALANATCRGSPEYFRYACVSVSSVPVLIPEGVVVCRCLVEAGGVEALCLLLSHSDDDIVKLVLKGLHRVMQKAGSQPNHSFIQRLRAVKADVQIGKLLTHSDVAVHQIAKDLLNFFSLRPLWSPEGHWLWPAEFRVAVRTMLLVHTRVDQTPLSLLPHEVLLLVVEALAAAWEQDVQACFGIEPTMTIVATGDYNDSCHSDEDDEQDD